MVVFDATMMMLALWPDAPTPKDPVTQQPIDFASERVQLVVSSLEKNKTKIIIPAPALSEVLVRAGKAGPKIVSAIQRSSAFRIEDFGAAAAVEVAMMTRYALDSGSKRDGDGTWAKIKYDRQIAAIAKVSGAKVIYSDDKNVRSFCERADISVIGLASCPLPEKPPMPPLLRLLEAKRDENTPAE